MAARLPHPFTFFVFFCAEEVFRPRVFGPGRYRFSAGFFRGRKSSDWNVAAGWCNHVLFYARETLPRVTQHFIEKRHASSEWLRNTRFLRDCVAPTGSRACLGRRKL